MNKIGGFENLAAKSCRRLTFRTKHQTFYDPPECNQLPCQSFHSQWVCSKAHLQTDTCPFSETAARSKRRSIPVDRSRKPRPFPEFLRYEYQVKSLSMTGAPNHSLHEYPLKLLSNYQTFSFAFEKLSHPHLFLQQLYPVKIQKTFTKSLASKLLIIKSANSCRIGFIFLQSCHHLSTTQNRYSMRKCHHFLHFMCNKNDGMFFIYHLLHDFVQCL